MQAIEAARSNQALKALALLGFLTAYLFLLVIIALAVP
jgi:stage V sporulation protein SpoVS